MLPRSPRGRGDDAYLRSDPVQASRELSRPGSSCLGPFGPKDAGGPGDATPPRGLSPFGFARVGNLEPTELAARRNFGRSPFWEGPSHALPDPGKTPASNASRPPLASAVNDGPATSMSRLAGHLVLADAEIAIPRR